MHAVRFVMRHDPSQDSHGRSFARRFTPENLLWLIIAFGIVLRLTQYLHNRSLWLDEAMLAVNIIERSFAELLTPLHSNQGAPIGFLLVQKVFVELCGTSEYALRLFPLMCGIVSVTIFLRVARGALDRTPAVIFAVAAFAISYKMIFYASEAKQYSSDVAITLALHSMTQRIQAGGFDAKRSLALGLGGAVAIWFSHPAVFVLGGIGLGLAVSLVSKKAMAKSPSLMIPVALWAVSFATSYLVSLRELGRNQELLEYWDSAFMPFPPRVLSELRWFDEAFFNFLREPLGLLPTSVAGVAFLTGGLSLAVKRKAEFVMLAAPVLFALLASGLKAYPFSGRLLLFAVPFAVIAIAEGMIALGTLARDHERLVTGAVAAGLLVPQLVFSSAILGRPYSFEEVRPAIAYVRERWSPGDVLYVYNGARPTFQYYAGTYHFEPGDYVLGHGTRENLSELYAEVDSATERKRVWMLFGHVNRSDGIDDEHVLRQRVGARSEVTDSFRHKDAAVYLYESRGR